MMFLLMRENHNGKAAVEKRNEDQVNFQTSFGLTKKVMITGADSYYIAGFN